MPCSRLWQLWCMGIQSRIVSVNKTNRCTELQFHWYYDSTCFGQPFCQSSGVLSRTSALVHFMQLWWPFATRSRMELQCHPAPGSKRSSKLRKMYQCRCTSKNSWWWAERLPETCRISILLLVANGHHICIKCTNADVRLRTPDDRQKGCPKHVES